MTSDQTELAYEAGLHCMARAMLRVMCSQIATKQHTHILCQSIHLSLRTMQDVDADIIIRDMTAG
jgi:hypothetical protein